MIKSDIFMLLHINQNTEIKYWSRSIHRPQPNNHKTSNIMVCITSKKVLDLRTTYTRYIQKWQKTNFLLVFIYDFYDHSFHHHIMGQSHCPAYLNICHWHGEIQIILPRSFWQLWDMSRPQLNRWPFPQNSLFWTVELNAVHVSGSRSMFHPHSAWKTLFFFP